VQCPREAKRSGSRRGTKRRSTLPLIAKLSPAFWVIRRDLERDGTGRLASKVFATSGQTTSRLCGTSRRCTNATVVESPSCRSIARCALILPATAFVVPAARRADLAQLEPIHSARTSISNGVDNVSTREDGRCHRCPHAASQSLKFDERAGRSSAVGTASCAAAASARSDERRPQDCRPETSKTRLDHLLMEENMSLDYPYGRRDQQTGTALISVVSRSVRSSRPNAYGSRSVDV